LTDDANHNETDRVRYQAVTPDGCGARRRRAARGRTSRRRAGWGSGLESPEARALLSLIPTSISVSASSSSLVYGQTTTLSAVVTTPSGDPIPTASDGTVSFYEGATLLGTAKLSGSPARADVDSAALAGGTRAITATYSGDSRFAASASVVQPSSVESVVPAAGLTLPYGVAVDRAGDVFIADLGNNRVAEVKPDGTQSTFISGLNGPRGVAVDGAGDLFIADLGNNRVVEVKPGGAQTTVGSELENPEGVAVDGAGDVFIADTNHSQVVEVKPDGTQTTVGSGLFLPSDVAVDGMGDVFIVDASNNRVVEVKPNGAQTTVGSGLNSPYGVAVDGAGDLFITDDDDGRVVVMKADGKQTTVATGFSFPAGVAVDGAGDVFIADPGDQRVVEVTVGIRVTVNQDKTNTTLASSANPSVNGEEVSFTATVAAISPGAGTPTGTVTFMDGTTILGTATLDGVGGKIRPLSRLRRCRSAAGRNSSPRSTRATPTTRAAPPALWSRLSTS
jgi:sugar lactone lactonase YvrE